MKKVALLLQEHGLGTMAGPVADIAEWEYLDAAVLAAFSLLTVVMITALIRGMLAYRKEREIEGG